LDDILGQEFVKLAVVVFSPLSGFLALAPDVILGEGFGTLGNHPKLLGFAETGADEFHTGLDGPGDRRMGHVVLLYSFSMTVTP
jgi:hypothetical protein